MTGSAVLHKTCLDLHEIDLLSAVILRETEDEANRCDLRPLPHDARQGRVKTVGPMNDSALERVSSESIPSETAHVGHVDDPVTERQPELVSTG